MLPMPSDETSSMPSDDIGPAQGFGIGIESGYDFAIWFNDAKQGKIELEIRFTKPKCGI